jgi:hypothetical protein
MLFLIISLCLLCSPALGKFMKGQSEWLKELISFFI